MRIVSVNVALPRLVEWRDEVVETGIFKQPVTAPVRVRRTNLDGDGQADARVHGGADKAVYGYPSEHYAFWRAQLDRSDLSWGMFGENLTTDGLLETDVRIGDVFAVGSAELEVSQPRLPCFKLGIKFGRPDMVKRFLRSHRLGFYFRVRREGVLAAGDSITRIGSADPHAPTIAELARLESDGKRDVALLERAVRCAALAESWRREYAQRLARGEPQRGSAGGREV
jgi:MOSC domain-containing protein YiiM